MDEVSKKDNGEKREREGNWTWEEKEILKDILAPYAAVVDCKMNNTNMIAKKNEAWKKISEDLKAYGMEFPIGKLTAQWGRLKTNARSNISACKRELNATGGGSEPKERDGMDYAIKETTPIDFEEDSADFYRISHLGAIAFDTDVEENNQPPSIKRQKISLSEQLLQKGLNK